MENDPNSNFMCMRYTLFLLCTPDFLQKILIDAYSFRLIFLIGFLILRVVELEGKLIKCEEYGVASSNGDTWDECHFKNVQFDNDTELQIYPPVDEPEKIEAFRFESSSIFLVHPYLLSDFPNVREIRLEKSTVELINQEKLENCENITRLDLYLNNFTRVSSNTVKQVVHGRILPQRHHYHRERALCAIQQSENPLAIFQSYCSDRSNCIRQSPIVDRPILGGK